MRFVIFVLAVALVMGVGCWRLQLFTMPSTFNLKSSSTKVTSCSASFGTG